MRRSDFHFDLPDALIARHPTPERSASRLLHLDGRTGALVDRQFRDLPTLLRPDDLLVFNDTRVVPARLFGHKVGSGGKVELMLERLLGGRRAIVQLRASKPSRDGTVIDFGAATATVVGRDGEFWCVEFDRDAHEVFEQLGQMPLPPYVGRPAEDADRERYQTVYAREPGAVAAPTAGLHFDEATLAACRAAGASFAYVTLHVGAGTFQPVRVDDIAQHRMHAEVYEVPVATCEAIAETRRRGGRVIAVGTTAVRSLESAAASGDGVLRPTSGETRLFLTPGCRFHVVDAMVTNFHLPESTLLMLVSAFATREHVLAAYAHAVEQRYRFFSYGDAMFVEPSPAALAPRNPA